MAGEAPDEAAAAATVSSPPAADHPAASQEIAPVASTTSAVVEEITATTEDVPGSPTNSGNGSPCFDISEFLGTPRKDGSNANNNTDEVFSNLSGLNLSPSSFNMLPEADFSTLLMYQQHKGGEFGGDCCSLDVKDSIFGDVDTLVNNSSYHHHHHQQHQLHHHVPPGEARLSFPPANMFGQHGSFLGAGDAPLPPPPVTGSGGVGGEQDLNHPGSLVATMGVGGQQAPPPPTSHPPPPPCSSSSSSFAGTNAACEWGGVVCDGAAAPHHHQLHHHHLSSSVQQLQCDSCQILRCIIHSNGILAAQSSNIQRKEKAGKGSNREFWAPGVQDTKLEIHGCDNISCHAVLHTRFCIDDGFPTALEQQMVEFPVGNAEYVRQFLLQYSLLRRKEGFVLRHDSLAGGVDQGLGYGFVPERGFGSTGAFIPKQIGSDFSSNANAFKPGQTKLLPNGAPDVNDQGEPSAAPAKPPKSNAAAQRERTGKLKMSDLAQHFHLPINAAAKELGICPTVLKKICRRNGMRRWPHRKIKSIERIIATLEQTIAEGAGQGDEGIRMEIAMLRNERAQLCAGLLGQN